MGKRSDFVKLEKDQYMTPLAAVIPLLPFLPTEPFGYAEPCAGDGRLVHHIDLNSSGICTWASEIDPDAAQLQPHQITGIKAMDALDLNSVDLIGADYIITNPPWTRTKASGYILHRMIEHFSNMRPTWLLFDADWIHTVQAVQYLNRLEKIVAVGRVKWIEDSKMTGKDNCAWHLFRCPEDIQGPPRFYGRGIAPE